jgi:hypothetical protein
MGIKRLQHNSTYIQNIHLLIELHKSVPEKYRKAQFAINFLKEIANM